MESAQTSAASRAGTSDRGARGSTDLERIVRAAAMGDEGAWSALFERFTPTILRVARSQGLGAADAEDVAEATWLRFVQSVGSIRDANAVAGWLMTVARRESLRLRSGQGRETQAGLVPVGEEAEDPDQIDDRIDHDEARAAVNRALESLPERHRRLMERLLAADQPSYHEIAEQLDMPVGSIGPIRGRVLARLRQDPQVAKALQTLL